MQILNPVTDEDEKIEDEKIEAEIDVVSEDAETPTVSTLHGQFAEMNVVQPHTTSELHSPHHTHTSASAVDDPSLEVSGTQESADAYATGYANQMVRSRCMKRGYGTQ